VTLRFEGVLGSRSFGDCRFAARIPFDACTLDWGTRGPSTAFPSRSLRSGWQVLGESIACV